MFSDTVNTGIYIVEPEVLQRFEKNKEFDFSKDLFPILLNERDRLMGRLTLPMAIGLTSAIWKCIEKLNSTC